MNIIFLKVSRSKRKRDTSFLHFYFEMSLLIKTRKAQPSP